MKNPFETFGISILSEEIIKDRTPNDIYSQYKKIKKEGLEFDKQTLNEIARVIKDWALENNATHYTHWFQPLTDSTAEKHESFLEYSNNFKIINELSGSSLLKSEVDASSFPNGGLRSTDASRGYTVWDYDSFIFIKGEGNNKTLYIPAIYIGYNGESLDKKTPLLKSIKAIKQQIAKIEKIITNKDANNIDVTLGIEQEYFLVNRELAKQRKDLMITGRTLFGAMPPKGQEMNDHYYSIINDKVESFMSDLDNELWKLSIPAKTKHNEVTPNQFELACLFNTANVAVDQNYLVMEIIKKIAIRNNLVALLNEKPYDNVNGSGKHCNWSLMVDNKNIFDPSTLTKDNYGFLLYITAVIEAINKYANILSLSVASSSNDKRLGSHEAPPSIISVYISDVLANILDKIETFDLSSIEKVNETLNVGILNNIIKDISDRNRTSPFAFTGNKFEFRTPGSKSSVANPVIVINTIVADVLKDYACILEKETDIKKGIINLIKKRYQEHKRVVFNGDGYSKAWLKEAKQRSLSNLANTVDALKYYIDEDTIALFERNGIYSKKELLSRFDVYSQKYWQEINIEALVAIDMFNRQIYPSILGQIDTISKTIINFDKLNINSCSMDYDKTILEELIINKNKAYEIVMNIQSKLTQASELDDNYQKANFYHKEIVALLNELRIYIDNIEKKVDEKIWPLPGYQKLLFNL